MSYCNNRSCNQTIFKKKTFWKKSFHTVAEDFEVVCKEEIDHDADEDDDTCKESSDEESKDFMYNHEYCNHSSSTADCMMTIKNLCEFHGLILAAVISTPFSL